MSAPKLFTGSAHPKLAADIAAQLGVQLADGTVERFPDGEAHVRLNERVRGEDVFLVQPTGPPPDAHLVELALMADACRRAGAGRVTAVIPYFAYSRADHRSADGEAVGTRVAADVLTGAGVERIVVVDPHTTALEAASAVPVESITAVPTLAAAVTEELSGEVVIVAPDLGAVKLAERFCELLDAPGAFVRKTRLSGSTVETAGIVGEVRDRLPVIVDDMITTAGTIEAAAAALRSAGCEADLVVAATHGLLVADAVDRLSALPLQRLVLSDSLPVSGDLPLPLRIESLAEPLGRAITRLHRHEPLAELASRG